MGTPIKPNPKPTGGILIDKLVAMGKRWKAERENRRKEKEEQQSSNE